MDDIIKRMQCKLFHFFSCDKFHLKGIKGLLAVVLMGGILVGCSPKIENNQNEEKMTTLQLTQEWDKKFPQCDKVDPVKVTFKNRYGI